MAFASRALRPFRVLRTGAALRCAGAALGALLVLALGGAAVPSLPTPLAHTSEPPALGADISYPQCRALPPSNVAFGVVGVNHGTSTTTNPCLAAELAWANGTAGGTAQPKLQLYINTSNPGEPGPAPAPAGWPKSGSTPYGTCSGQSTSACAWQFGWDRAAEDVAERLAPAARSAGLPTGANSYTWWLDVETANTWQPDTTANRAVLEGMTASLAAQGARIGLYSTARQWGRIVGSAPSTSPLAALPEWLAGATTADGAKELCSQAPLTSRGRVELAQYMAAVDGDYPCPG
ncbi:glycoside hydrolase family 25 domain-containing protein [Sinomonas albida]|uniref:hypothetical protein n=1 Tax=Sinomonas albida TaxID=369942 RepID=UPI001F2DC69F|nr:hypothetical protein [Sinomonas albida]